MKTLFWDIETSLQPVAVFQLAHNDYIDPSSILEERYIICASWKWEGESTVHAVSTLDDPKRYARNPHDDTHVVKTLHAVLSQADVLIHHNGDSYDRPYLDTRILKLGLPALPPIQSIDTCKVAKTKFRFNSNKLDYLGTFLNLGNKTHTSHGLWLRVLQGTKGAVREMVDYNKQDVRLLERVYLALRPYCSNHTNRELFGGKGCPRCNSRAVHARGLHRALTKIYQRFQCQSCGGWFRLLRGEAGTTRTRVL